MRAAPVLLVAPVNLPRIQDVALVRPVLAFTFTITFVAADTVTFVSAIALLGTAGFVLATRRRAVRLESVR